MNCASPLHDIICYRASYSIALQIQNSPHTKNYSTEPARFALRQRQNFTESVLSSKCSRVTSHRMSNGHRACRQGYGLEINHEALVQYVSYILMLI